jgi:predicted DCC family thiol-disulfide oxidoreductase YuxK
MTPVTAMSVPEAKAGTRVLEPELTVFYDGGCPACSREIDLYRRRESAGRVAWVNLWTAREALQARGISFDEAMRFLHALDADGVRHVGVEAFIEIWRRVPGFGAAAFFAGLPGVRTLAGLAYRVFATWVRPRLPRRCALPPSQNERAP